MIDVQAMVSQASLGEIREPFYVGNRRAMVSLGPLTRSAYCSYRCQFCYVQGPFPRYAPKSVQEAVSWLEQRRSLFDIVYVSGDTDSFARPRTAEGLQLLEALLTLDVDVLFTTRYVFNAEERRRLADAVAAYRANGRLLLACISVSQLRHPRLEPAPIASPQARLEQLSWLHDIGGTTILTIRPLIPLIPAEDYLHIAELGHLAASVVLASEWYCDLDGVIESLTAAALGGAVDGYPSRIEQLDFTDAPDQWRIYSHPEAEQALERFCRDAEVPFFLRSGPAIEYLRLHK